MLLFFKCLSTANVCMKGPTEGNDHPRFFQSQNREYWQSSSELCKIVRKQQSKGVLHLPASCLALPVSGTTELSSFIKVPPLSHLETSFALYTKAFLAFLVWAEFLLPCFSLRDSHSNDLTLLQVTTLESAGSQQIPTNVNNLEAINMRGKLRPSWAPGLHYVTLLVNVGHISPQISKVGDSISDLKKAFTIGNAW